MNKVKEYFSTPRISNSMLGMLNNPFWIKYKRDHPEMEDEEHSYFRIGSAIDCLLTDHEQFDEEFVVISSKRPYGLMGKFIDFLPPGLTPTSALEEYKYAYEKAGYKQTLERVVERFWESDYAVEYYNGKQVGEDKMVLGQDEFEIVQNCKYLILSNPFTVGYFRSDDPNIELHHQVPIYFEYKGYECKGLLDGIQVNHKEKTIQPFDLKTTGHGVRSFRNTFIKFGYFRQAAFYTEALKTWIKEQSLIRDLSDYEVLPFQFIVVENKKSSVTPAYIYQCTEKDLECGMKGGETEDGQKVKGIDQLLDDLNWHETTGNWSLPREVYENGGIVVLDKFV